MLLDKTELCIQGKLLVPVLFENITNMYVCIPLQCQHKHFSTLS